MRHVVNVEVETPEDVSHEQVRRLIHKLINIGRNDAAESLELEEYDEDAILAVQIVVKH